MKIKYNLEYNYFEFYNEAQGIVNFKQSVYKNEYRPIKNYTSNGASLVKLTAISFILMVVFMLIKKEWFITKLLSFIFAASFALTFIFYIIFISFYNTEKNRCHRGELTINKNGILDTSDDGIRIGLPWHLIEALIITDKIICFTSKTMTFFFIESTHVDEVLEAVHTYEKDLKIIDKRLHRSVKIDEHADKEAKTINDEQHSEESTSDEKEKESVKVEEKSEEKTELFSEAKDEIKKDIEANDTEVEDKISELEGN
ncbi:MAG: hypothetical protein OSJ70_08630 [Bacilli bacterium]|nr:hypothetical protein [Bacilli bacterium]